MFSLIIDEFQFLSRYITADHGIGSYLSISVDEWGMAMGDGMFTSHKSLASCTVFNIQADIINKWRLSLL